MSEQKIVITEAHHAVHSEHPQGHEHTHAGGHSHGHEIKPYKVIGKLNIINKDAETKLHNKKYHVPVIGHFSNKSIEFKSIFEASAATGIHYTLIFEACIGKIFKAKNVIWEFKKGNHYIKYKAFYINAASTYKRKVGFNG